MSDAAPPDAGPVGDGRGRRVSGVWGHVVHALFVIGVVLIGLEGVVRAYSWLAFPRMSTYDAALGWRHAANVQRAFTTEGSPSLVVQNALGHRGPRYGARTAPGKKRVLVLGDSFAEGSSVNEDELFTSRIAAAAPGLEVLNAGVGGWGTVQELIYLQREGLALGPDVVLVMFFENDLVDNCLPFYPALGPRPYARMSDGVLTVVERVDYEAFGRFILPLPLAPLLHRNSLAYNFVNSRIYQPHRAAHLVALERRLTQETYRCPEMAIASALLGRMHALTRQHGRKLLVALIPTREAAQQGHSPVHDSVLASCRANGMPCVSLIAAMRNAYVAGRKPYFEADIHWRADGHAVAADALLPVLADLVAVTPDRK